MTPQVDLDLRRKCPEPTRQAATFRSVALLLIDYAEALDCANGKIVAIAATLKAFEERTGQ